MRSNILLLFILFSIPCFAQQEQLLENIKSNFDLPYDEIWLENHINKYINNPIDLNSADENDFLNFQFFSVKEIKLIINYRTKLNGFVSVEELKVLDIPYHKLLVIIPLLTVKNGAYQIKNTLNKEKYIAIGYKSRILENDISHNHFFRIKHKTSKTEVNIVGQQDYDEPFFQGYNQPSKTAPIKGYDHIIGNLTYYPNQVIRKVILGDYALNLGQGLLFWNSFAMQKSSYTTQTEKFGAELTPYSSANEFNYLRGVSTSIKYKSIKLTAFGSQKNLKGNIKTINKENFFNVNTSGFYNSPPEKNNESIIGLHSSINKKKVNIGASISYFSYQNKINPPASNYKSDEFHGDQLLNFTLDYNYSFSNGRLFGETLIQQHGGKGTLIGSTFFPSDNFETSIVYRSFSKNYYAHYGNAFGEYSTNRNENGVYWGSKLSINRYFDFNFYIDYYQRKNDSFYADYPTKGNDFLAQLNFYPSENQSLYLRYKNDQQELGTKDFTQKIYLRSVNYLRLQQNRIINDVLTLRTRTEIKWTPKYKNKSWMIYQDFIYKPFYRLSFNLRIAITNISDYETRIYTLDSNIPYNFQYTTFFENSSYSYFIIKYRLTKKVRTWFKISQYNKNDFTQNVFQTVVKYVF